MAPVADRRRLSIWLPFLLLLAVALVPRAVLVLAAERPATPYPANDEIGYHDLAVSLLEGRGMSLAREGEGPPTAIRTPGYPLLLAAAYAIGGASVRAGLLMGALADALTAGLLFLLARRVGGSAAAGLLAGGLWALLSPFLHWMDFLYCDTHGATLVAASLLCALCARSAGGALGAGLLWGAAVHVRPFLLPSALSAALPQGRRRAGWLVAGVLLLIVPWAVRNAVAFRAFVPLCYGQTGVVLWTGTWSTTGPLMVLEPDGRGGVRAVFAGPWAESPEEAAEVSRVWGRLMGGIFAEGGRDVLEADRELQRIGKRRILRDPLRWMGLRAETAAHVWLLPDVPGGKWVGGAIVLAALAGAVRLWRAGRVRELLHLALPVAVLLLAFLPLRVLPRHTATVAPALFALAALAVPWRRSEEGEVGASGELTPEEHAREAPADGGAPAPGTN
jgi:hypothetical protein